MSSVRTIATRAVLAFALVIVLSLLLEVVPQHFGGSRVPWADLLPDIKRRLPRVLLIAAAVAVFLSIPRRSGK